MRHITFTTQSTPFYLVYQAIWPKVQNNVTFHHYSISLTSNFCTVLKTAVIRLYQLSCLSFLVTIFCNWHSETNLPFHLQRQQKRQATLAIMIPITLPANIFMGCDCTALLLQQSTSYSKWFTLHTYNYCHIKAKIFIIISILFLKV